MTKHILPSLLALTLACAATAQAQQSATQAQAQKDVNHAFGELATGPTFQVGGTEFRLVPNAGVERTAAMPTTQAQARQASSSGTPANGSTVIGTLGAFSIVLNPVASAQAQASSARAGVAGTTSQGSGDNGLAVAVNTRSGLPVIVAPRLKLFVQDATVVKSLAKNTGGTVVYASTVDGSALIKYDSVASAQAAITSIKAAKGVDDVALDVIQNFQQKQ